MAFYSDKPSVFYVKQRSQTAGEGVTQFGRALYELNIDVAQVSRQVIERVREVAQHRAEQVRERYSDRGMEMDM